MGGAVGPAPAAPAPPLVSQTSTSRRILDLLTSPRAPEGWGRAATRIQKKYRGFAMRRALHERGGTIFKSQFEYMTLRKLSPVEATLLAFFCLLHQAIFLVLFTEPGWGDEIFRMLMPYASVSYAIGWGGVVLALVWYLLDVHLWAWWGTRWKSMAAFLFGVSGLAVLVGLVLSVGAYPQAPLCVYLFLTYAFLYSLRTAALSETSMSHFLFVVAAPTFAGGLFMFSGWLAWVGVSGAVWSGATRREYYSLMLCEPYATSCLAAAILYFSPMACGILNISTGVVAYFLALSSRPRGRKTMHIGVRIFVGTVCLVLCAMYIQAAVSGANSQLANSVLLFALAALVAITFLVGYSVGWQVVRAKAMNVPLLKKAHAALVNDWSRAVIVFGGWAPGVVFIAVSLVKQQLRICFWLKRGQDEVTDAKTDIRVVRSSWLTAGAGTLWDQVAVWAWTSVLTKAIWIGVFFMVMNVGFGKLTNVFVAALIESLLAAQVGLGIVIAVVCAVGMVFFMLPPVPGFAVYLMASFLIPRFMEFWTGVALSIAISFGLKMSACLVQQKIIGGQMGDLIAVRSLIAVNSTTTRAIRRLLEEPGWGLGKICILVGGPDWPTSVCCGILKLPALRILLGTVPVVIVVAAVTVAGACQLRRSEGGVWASVSNMTLGLASAVMLITLVAAAYFIEDTAEKHREELDAMPRDKEVDELDQKQEVNTHQFKQATAWAHPTHPLPLWMRANLVMGLALQVVSCYVAQLFTNSCFVAFEMTDSVAVKLDGNVGNLFKPLGRYVLIVWLVSCGNLLFFRLWARQRVRRFLRSGQLEPLEEGQALVRTQASSSKFSNGIDSKNSSRGQSQAASPRPAHAQSR